jgi:hypothetical protein
MRKTGTKWKTDKCGRCGEAHSGYSGKLDKDGVEYVVCGVMHKRMNVGPLVENIRDVAFHTIWVKEEE